MFVRQAVLQRQDEYVRQPWTSGGESNKLQIDIETGRSAPVMALIGSALFVGAKGDRAGLAEPQTYCEPLTHWSCEAGYTLFTSSR